MELGLCRDMPVFRPYRAGATSATSNCHAVSASRLADMADAGRHVETFRSESVYRAGG
jgi:hypothetical protein